MLIRLTFIRFNAQRGTVRVRDGNSSLSNLLLRVDGGSAVLPPPLTSTGDAVRVEYVLPPAEAFDTDVINGGFVALFLAISMYSQTGLYLPNW